MSIDNIPVYSAYKNQAANDNNALEPAQQPPLPSDAQPMLIEVEDEDADPVTDAGPGITHGS